MRKIFILGALGAFLAGCASGGVNPSQLDAAAHKRDLAVAECQRQVDAGQLKTALDGLNCGLDAARTMSNDLNLTRPDIFDAYAAKARAAAADADAGRITVPQMRDRIAQAQKEADAKMAKASR